MNFCDNYWSTISILLSCLQTKNKWIPIRVIARDFKKSKNCITYKKKQKWQTTQQSLY